MFRLAMSKCNFDGFYLKFLILDLFWKIDGLEMFFISDVVQIIKILLNDKNEQN